MNEPLMINNNNNNLILEENVETTETIETVTKPLIIENSKTCIICLECEINENPLIEYNHCGIYNIHNSCLNTWDTNECIICRTKFNEFSENDIETGIIELNLNDNNNNQQSVERRNKLISCYFKLVVIDVFIIIANYIYHNFYDNEK